MKSVDHIVNNRFKGRAPHGARGLKFVFVGFGKAVAGRAPHGARGLKSRLIYRLPEIIIVAPRTGRED